MLQAAKTAGTSPVVMARNAAIVQSSVFDAVNGIERRYAPMFVQPAAAAGASRGAAAVQAAYAALVKLYPSQQADLSQKRESSLAAIGSEDSAENSRSIQRGVEWGQTVADAIWVHGVRIPGNKDLNLRPLGYESITILSVFAFQ